jgi:hypothetical protein
MYRCSCVDGLLLLLLGVLDVMFCNDDVAMMMGKKMLFLCDPSKMDRRQCALLLQVWDRIDRSIEIYTKQCNAMLCCWRWMMEGL